MAGLLRVLLLVGFAVKFWWLLLGVLVAAAVGFGLWCAAMRLDGQLERQRREHAALAARADQQHARVLAGDDRGIYGEHIPEQID